VSRGVPRLNEVKINVDKDWLAYLIKNLGTPVDAGDAFRLGDEITDAMHGSRGAITDAHSHDDLAGITTDQHHAQDHETRHESGGADALPIASQPQPGDDTKITLGAGPDYSLYYDSAADEYVLYDEVNAVKLLRLPKNTTIANTLESGGVHELLHANMNIGTDDHHAQNHEVRHESGGADALPLANLPMPGDDTKIQLGAGPDFSILYDSANDDFRIRDEVNAVETSLPKNVAMNLAAHAARHESGGADEVALDAAQITSGRFGMPRMPDGTDGYVLTAKGAGVDPAYETAPAGAPNQKIISKQTVTKVGMISENTAGASGLLIFGIW